MDFFGLDIGSVTTKVAQIKRSGKDKYRVEGAAVIETPVGGMVAEADANLTTMAETLKKAINEAKISTKNVSAALPESEVFTRIISMPKMSKTELESAITWEAEQNIPLPLSEVNFSFNVVDTQPNGAMEVMVVAAPKRLVDRYERVFSLAGLTPVALETELLAAGRFLVPATLGDPVVVVISGAQTSDIGIMKLGNLVFTRSIATAGEALTRSIMTTLQLEPGQAEAFKRTYGMATNQLEGKVANAMKPVVEVLIREIRRTVNFYESKSGGMTVKTAVLAGGTANLPEVVSLLASGLNIEVQTSAAITKLDQSKKGGVITPELLPVYAVALGLGMKEI